MDFINYHQDIINIIFNNNIFHQNINYIIYVLLTNIDDIIHSYLFDITISFIHTFMTFDQTFNIDPFLDVLDPFNLIYVAILFMNICLAIVNVIDLIIKHYLNTIY